LIHLQCHFGLDTLIRKRRQGLQPSGYIDAVTVDVISLGNHVPEVDPDTERDPVLGGVPAWRSSIPRCTSTAHRTASTTLANSAKKRSPVFLTTYATVHSAAPFYSVLIRINPENPSSTTDFVCDLCTAMPQPTDDGKTYTFKIRDGVKFHDGSPLTSADVAASWNAIVHPPEGVSSARESYYIMVDNVEAPDPAGRRRYPRRCLSRCLHRALTQGSFPVRSDQCTGPGGWCSRVPPLPEHDTLTYIALGRLVDEAWYHGSESENKENLELGRESFEN
jgi:hypothetical protein